MTNFRLSGVDQGIVTALNQNARVSVAKIAERLKVPESTVRHRLRRLIKQGVIEFSTMMNPLKFGYQIWALIEVQVELSKLRSVANALADWPEVFFVGVVSGGYDIFVGALFRTNSDLLTFITEKLAKTPGIIRTSTSSVLDVVKRGAPSVTMFSQPIDGEVPQRVARRPGARKAAGKKGGVAAE